MPATLRHTSSSTPPMKGRARRAGWAALPVILAMGMSLILAPAASAGQPTRTELVPADYVIPAGFGCAFDVQVQYDADYWVTQFEFSDGRLMFIVNGERTLTNLQTGATLDWQNNVKRTEVYSPATNDLVIDNSGRIALEYWPGDVDHTGQVVGEDGALYGFVGHLQATLDFDTGSFTSSTLHGWAIDLCAELSD